ncbi:hypothetical protein JCM19992_20870 [Thermostilla marina]
MRRMVALVAVTVVLAGGVAFGQPAKRPNPEGKTSPQSRLHALFTELDTNKDKALSLEEFAKGKRFQGDAERAKRFFARVDADGDGKVTIQEFAKALTVNPEVVFKRLDANGDGKVTIEEILKARRVNKDEAAAKALLAKLDSNKDGVIDVKEFTAGWNGGHARPAKPGEGPGKKRPAAGKERRPVQKK